MLALPVLDGATSPTLLDIAPQLSPPRAATLSEAVSDVNPVNLVVSTFVLRRPQVRIGSDAQLRVADPSSQSSYCRATLFTNRLHGGLTMLSVLSVV